MTLYNRALKILSLRAHSCRELRLKLLKIASEAEVLKVLERLRSQGLLDDEAFAYQRASGLRRSKLWGGRRLSRDLHQRGISADIAQRALNRLDKEYPEEEALQRAFERWTRDRPPRTIPELKKIFQRALRMGYSASRVRLFLHPYFQNLGREL